MRKLWMRFKIWLIKKLGGTHLEFEKLLTSGDSDVVRGEVQNHYHVGMDDRNLWPNIYGKCEERGVAARGWKLRFLMYYWAGVKAGDWD